MGNGCVPGEAKERVIRRVVESEGRVEFVETPYLKGLVNRALGYLKAGLPVNLSGPAGTGKTTLALRLAEALGRPTVLIHGDDELITSDLTGGLHGYRRMKLFDNYIHAVRKTEERVSPFWVDNRLATACQQGFTFVYDEFTRARPEANNVLLSVLEERALDLPGARGEEAVREVHPEFRGIFTSNPDEYAGVHKAQDALMDRMVTLKLDHLDRHSAVAVTSARTGVSEAEAGRIVDVVNGFREMFKEASAPALRPCIMIGKCLAHFKARATSTDNAFVHICCDVLCKNGMDRQKAAKAIVELVTRYCK